MTDIGAFAAKTHFSQLLDRVEKGEEITISRRGRVVARLVPAVPHRDPAEIRDAIARIRAHARKMKLGPFNWEEWKQYRDEGRK